MLDWGAGPRRCAIGPAGIGPESSEGDGITPLGVFPLREIFYRADRTEKPDTILPARALVPEDGWCDAPDDPNYNRLVKLPYPASAEHLWRDRSSLRHHGGGRASMTIRWCRARAARFSCIWRATDYPPTAGCVALTDHDLRAALAQFRPRRPGPDHWLDFHPRAKDRGADPHMGRAEPHRHLEIAAHAHAEFAQAILRASLARKAKCGATSSRRAECTSGRSSGSSSLRA